MDLYAYSQIENLEPILEACNLDIPRLRGLRLMKFSEPTSQEDIDKSIKSAKVSAVKDWLQQHAWNFWCGWKEDKKHPAFIYGYEDWDTEHKCRDVVDYDFSKVHGKDRKILKFEFKKIAKAYSTEYGLFNKFAGKDVLYVHARAGGGNRGWCKTNDLRSHPLYLADCDDAFDETYCDFYFDISGIDLDKIDFKKEEQEEE